MAHPYQNVFLLAYPRTERQWECRCLNFGVRSTRDTLLECIGSVLEALNIHQRWEGEVGRSFGERAYSLSAAEAMEFCNVFTRGAPVSMELTERPGLVIKSVSMSMSTYALWLTMEPIRSVPPRPVAEGEPVSFENPGGVK